jgi:hypothetical protein
MFVVFARWGLAVSLVAVASACTSERNEWSGAPQTSAGSAGAYEAGAYGSAPGSSGCEIIKRFSKVSFIAADRNHDGVVDEAEYAGDAAAAFAGEDSNLDSQLTQNELPGAPAGSFQRINVSHNGAVTFKEVMQMKLSEFQSADTNGDGVLTLAEVTQFNMRQGGC